jgi:hypothetical protein
MQCKQIVNIFLVIHNLFVKIRNIFQSEKKVNFISYFNVIT